MTPLTTMRLIFLPVALLGLYLATRILIPGPLGIVIALTVVAAGLLWAALAIRRSRGRGQER